MCDFTNSFATNRKIVLATNFFYFLLTNKKHNILTHFPDKNAKMYDFTTSQKTTRFWIRIIYSLACFAMTAATISMNYTGCDAITGIQRGIGIGTIIFWLNILRNIFQHRALELALAHELETPQILHKKKQMAEINSMNIIGFCILFLFNFPVMLHYKLYDTSAIPQECSNKAGYHTLLALLVLNSVPVGVNLILALGTIIGVIFTLIIRCIGFWFINYSLNYTWFTHIYFGTHGGFWRQSRQPQQPSSTVQNPDPNNQVVLDIELPEPSTTEPSAPEPNITNHTATTTSETTAKECPVCLEEKSIYLKMKCGHTLCLICANNWFGENQSCPVCRNAISRTPNNLALTPQHELAANPTESAA